MAINGWFPAFNSRGEIARGAGEIFVGTDSFGTGWNPKWATDDVIVYNGGAVTIVQNVRTRTILDASQPAYNLYGAGGGLWAGFSQGVPGFTQRYVLPATLSGAAIVGGAFPAFSFGGRFAYFEPYQAALRNLWVDGVNLRTGQIRTVSISDHLVVWTEESSPGAQITWGRIDAGALTNMTVENWEDPRAIDTPFGPWILSNTLAHGLGLRPAGAASFTYVLPGGEWFNPAAVFVTDRFLIAASDHTGAPHDVTIIYGTPGGGTGPVVGPCA